MRNQRLLELLSDRRERTAYELARHERVPESSVRTVARRAHVFGHVLRRLVRTENPGRPAYFYQISDGGVRRLRYLLRREREGG